jgi:FlaA1/EpsC-like NDP-sugar epimerase
MIKLFNDLLLFFILLFNYFKKFILLSSFLLFSLLLSLMMSIFFSVSDQIILRLYFFFEILLEMNILFHTSYLIHFILYLLFEAYLNFFSSSTFRHTALAAQKRILIVGSGNSALDLCTSIQKARNALNGGCPGVSGGSKGTGVCCMRREDIEMGGHGLSERAVIR